MAFSTLLTNSSSPHAYFRKTASPIIRRRRPVRCSSASPVSTGFDLKTYWTTLIKEIDQKLDEAAPVKYPEQIHEAMRYSLIFTKGAKRAPPVMCIAACELFGGDRAVAFPTACALEMVHAASLVHDDLPYMDDDQSRRGQPSNHMIYGIDMAILAGDALFPLGFRHIVTHTPSDLIPSSRIIQVIAEIARSVGSTGMAAGKFLDLDGSPSLADFVQQKKFGEMGQCSAVCGGILGGASKDEIGRLRCYGQAVGVLYQVVEDVLKVEKGEKNERSKNYVSVYGVERAMEMVEELRLKAIKELEGLEKLYGEKLLPLYAFLDFAVNRGFSIDLD